MRLAPRQSTSYLITLTLLAHTIAPAVAATDKDTIKIHFHQRPPYMSQDDSGNLVGLVATPALQALQSLHVTLKLQKTPAARQLSELSNSQMPECALGWFFNEQRDELYQYSLPLYQDRPLIGLTQSSNLQLQSSARLANVLTDERLTALVKQGYSYGSYIDTLLAASDQVLRVTAENDTMLNMIAANRADYMLLAPEEYTGLLYSQSHQHEQFRTIEFSDLQQGENRYLICNQSMPQRWMQEVNQWITHHLVLPHL